ncbi:MAG TPA: glycoside hydrolase family 32 protein [Microbacterium sp.]|nr:glycoside hydrolase family 32 protein [Microbacterium sp.]
MNTGSAALTHAHTGRRRRAMAVAASVVAVLAIVAAFLIPSPSVDGTAPPATPTSAPSEAAPGFTRPSEWEQHRPAVHLTPEQHWMNDPQRPFLLDGVWHYYYLYNADYPEGNGTAWYHSTSTDLVHWQDHGVAIEKYTNGLGDIWTGTAVVDHDNTAGFGDDAVIAMVTQQSDGVQRQSLFVSLDGGYSFDPYDGNPVMDNPGTKDFRDPRLVWDAERGVWIMALAEGGKIGLYTSPDLKDWTYRSGFTAPGLGVLECPDLFQMAVDGDPSTVRWVLAAGANGEAEGMTTGTVYWIGDWDGETFTPDSDEAQWLDRGSDYYAAVTWDDPSLPPAQRLSERYSIGWLNNWAYAGDLPTEQWHGGSDSIVRTLRLTSGDAGLALESSPVDALRGLEGDPLRTGATTVIPDDDLDLPDPGSDAYRVTVELPADRQADAEVRLQVPRGADGAFTTVGYDFATETAFVARDADAIAAGMPDAYRAIRTASAPPRDGVVRLDIIVDVGSVEVFVNDGAASLSMITLGSPDARGLRAAASRGPVEIGSATVTPLRVAPVQRSDG